jgi:hypothetical protein
MPNSRTPVLPTIRESPYSAWPTPRRRNPLELEQATHQQQGRGCRYD